MILDFNKVEKEWIAEFEATGDFNLHLERANVGRFVVMQSGVQFGEYVTVYKKNIYEGKIIDYDFGALVYPKWIKIISGSEVIKGEVTFA